MQRPVFTMEKAPGSWKSWSMCHSSLSCPPAVTDAGVRSLQLLAHNFITVWVSIYLCILLFACPVKMQTGWEGHKNEAVLLVFCGCDVTAPMVFIQELEFVHRVMLEWELHPWWWGSFLKQLVLSTTASENCLTCKDSFVSNRKTIWIMQFILNYRCPNPAETNEPISVSHQIWMASQSPEKVLNTYCLLLKTSGRWPDSVSLLPFVISLLANTDWPSCHPVLCPKCHEPALGWALDFQLMSGSSRSAAWIEHFSISESGNLA